MITYGKENFRKFLEEIESRVLQIDGAPEAMEVSINGEIMTFVRDELKTTNASSELTCESVSVDEILRDMVALKEMFPSSRVSIPQPSLFPFPSDRYGHASVLELLREMAALKSPDHTHIQIPIFDSTAHPPELESTAVICTCGEGLYASKDVVRGKIKCWKCERVWGDVEIADTKAWDISYDHIAGAWRVR